MVTLISDWRGGGDTYIGRGGGDISDWRGGGDSYSGLEGGW